MKRMKGDEGMIYCEQNEVGSRCVPIEDQLGLNLMKDQFYRRSKCKEWEGSRKSLSRQFVSAETSTLF